MHRNITELKTRYDVVVVGARVAGAATAMLLGRAGLDVLLVEQGAPGADTLSTLALMRGGVLQLSRWGLLQAIRASGTPRIQTTTFHYDGEPIQVRIKPKDGVDALYAPRRTVLDPILVRAAERAGVDVAWRTRLTGLCRSWKGRVSGASLEGPGGERRDIAAAWVVGADGTHSAVATTVDAAVYRAGPHAAAVIYSFIDGLELDGYHWHYVQGAAAGAIPTGGGEVLVFVSVPREHFMRELRHDLSGGFYRVLHQVVPWLAGAARVLGTTEPFRGFAGGTGYLRTPSGPGWALVGDAGYFKDPLTAHGLTDAMRDAELLSRALLTGTDTALAEYRAVRDALSLPLFEITDEIASFGWTMPRVQELHRRLSMEMAREVSYLAELPVTGLPPVQPAAVSQAAPV
jgi:2-polyprenyl-6-methoxyphenol hydroxylase-like FAD-dependent oxidoreductase